MRANAAPMPPVAPVMRTVDGCCQERREDCRQGSCPIVLSWLTVSLDVKAQNFHKSLYIVRFPPPYSQ